MWVFVLNVSVSVVDCDSVVDTLNSIEAVSDASPMSGMDTFVVSETDVLIPVVTDQENVLV